MSRGSPDSKSVVIRRRVRAAVSITALTALAVFSFDSLARNNIAFWKGGAGAAGAALLELLAGKIGGGGTLDGNGSAARIGLPFGTAVDSAGNVFVVDKQYHTIRKIDTSGNVTTFAGSPSVTGFQDGTGSAARFFEPQYIAIDGSDNLYVTEYGNHTVRKITPAGVVTTFAGAAYGADGTGAEANFRNPTAIVSDGAGNSFWVSDADHTVRKITNAGVVTTIAGKVGKSGYRDGTGTDALFTRPASIAIDSSGNLYVGDEGNYVVRKVTQAGVVTTLAGSPKEKGSADGTGSAAQFGSIYSLTVDASGNVFAADTVNFGSVLTSSIRKITPAGVVTTIAGAPVGKDGTGVSARVQPYDFVVDASGNIFFVEFYFHAIRKITPAGVVTTIAGNALVSGNEDGTGTAARFNQPSGITMDASGDLYVTDQENNSIRKVTQAGVVTTLAGSGKQGSDDGTGAAATFSRPAGIEIDGSGNLFVADRDNYTIRKITPAGVVTTFAGSAGVNGTTDGTGASALFYGPKDIVRDSAGDFHVLDGHAVRKMTAAGAVTTIAGIPNAYAYVNNTGSAARLHSPGKLTIDSSNNVYFTETSYCTVRKVTPGGVVTDFAGSTSSPCALSSNGTGSAARFRNVNAIATDSSGDMYVSSGLLIHKMTTAAVVTTHFGLAFGADGTGSAASLRWPKGLRFDSSGDLLIADSWNRTIRKMTPAGVVSTFAGSVSAVGSADGTGVAASFIHPYDITLDGSGNLFVVDMTAQTIRKITPGAVVTTVAGLSQTNGYVDATGSAARFFNPSGIAFDGTDLVIMDYSNHLIRKSTLAGVVTTLAGARRGADGTGATARLYSPGGLDFDSGGNLFVADTENQTIRKITPAGVVTTFAGTTGLSGTTDATGAAARFYAPVGLVIDSSDNIFVSSYNAIRKITSGAAVTTFAGSTFSSGSTDNTGTAARFAYPMGMAIDGSNNIFVADYDNHTIRKITPGAVVTTFAGSAGSSGYADATGTSALFKNPRGVSIDGSGNLYIGDSQNSVVRKVTSGAVVTTYAGLVFDPGATDGTGAAAKFGYPSGIVRDSSGNIYVADTYNQLIRKIDSSGTTSIYAGILGDFNADDGPRLSSTFGDPMGLAIDSSDNIYVADADNGLIRKISAAGVVSTIAGTLWDYGHVDGNGLAAVFSWPTGIAVDGSGNLYIGDSYTVRKINPAGDVTTLAGSGDQTGAVDGTGSAARFQGAMGVAVDGSGNVYVADSGNHAIRKITAAGVVTTLAGKLGESGDADGTGSAARFKNPNALALDASGNLIVADTDNHLLRKVTPAGVVTTVVGTPGSVGNMPGPLPASISSPLSVIVGGGTIYIGSPASVLKCPVP